KNYSQIINLFSEFLKISVTFFNNQEFQVEDLRKFSPLDETFLKEIDFNNLQLNFNHSSACINSALLIIKYLKITQKNEKISFNEINFFNPSNYLILDFSSQRNLELFQTILGAKKEGSLLWVLDHTITSMGGRLLRSFLERPLINKEQILLRQNAVKTLTESYSKVEKLRALFNKINDLERIAAKIEYAACNARDLLALKNSLEKLPQIKEELKNFEDLKLKELYLNLNPLEDIYQLIHKSIAENPPISLREGGLIKNNFNPDLDDLRNIKYQAKEWIAGLENQEKVKTGIKSLKIGFNQVFGYYIEITKPNLSLVPSTYIRKQTIANGERFINQELKDYEAQVLGAEEKIKNLEYEIFTQIREEIFKDLFKIRKTAKTLAYLDVFLNFAHLAANNNYIQPIINEEEKIIIKNGRHPVAEKILKENFIPNDINLNEEENLLIITGPNMAGNHGSNGFFCSRGIFSNWNSGPYFYQSGSFG
ncbi:MAG: DNA mismatch repair protein MutS, partial [Armatimonadetes bacterium]|nr:DNA mismatch repair protein MutS [Armatimonadota bacterium]